MKLKVIVSTRTDNDCWHIFESLNDISYVIFSSFSDGNELIQKLGDASVLLLAGEPVNETLLSHMYKLKVITLYGVGYDSIDVEACTKRGIYVTHTPGVLSQAVAELTMGLMIAVSRGMINSDHYVRTEWAKPEKTLFPLGVDLFKKTLGIIGLGRIGNEVAIRAKAFGMRLIYYDEIRRKEAEKKIGIQYEKFNDVFKISDYVTIHVPLNLQTKSLIGERELRLMKPSAYLINTSRGAVVDETALCKALKKSWIAGAGLDVFTTEPLPLESPLVDMRNVVLTNHIATHTIETRRVMASLCVENIRTVLLGKTPPNLVPEQKGKSFMKKD